MKNLSTYFTKVLNEKSNDDENILIDALDAKTPLKDILSKIEYTPNERDQTVTIKYDGKPVSSDDLNDFIDAIAENPATKKAYDEYKNTLSKDKPSLAKKIEKKLAKNKNTRGGASNKSENDFRKLGAALVFRTACAFGSNPDADFTKICKQLFSKDSDDRIKSLMTIEDQFSEYAAIKGFEEYKDKNQNTKDEDALNILEKLTPFYDKLCDQGTPDIEVQDAIKEISSTIQTEFKHYYDEAQAAFEEGREDMDKKIKDPNFDWKDPITNQVAKGSKNLKAGAQKLTNKLGEIADNMGKKIMNSPHNLENDMAKVAVIALKCVVGGVHAVRSICRFFGIGKSASAEQFIKNNKDTASTIEKLLGLFKKFLLENKAFKGLANAVANKSKNVANSITKKSDNKDINTMYDANGGGDKKQEKPKQQASYKFQFINDILNEEEQQQQEQPKEQPKEGQEDEETKKLREDFFNNKQGFKATGRRILDYIVKNYCYLFLLSKGQNSKICQFTKIENDEEENTYGFDFMKSGTLTLIQDKLNLYLRSLDYYVKFYDIIRKNTNEKLTSKFFIGDLMELPQTFDNGIEDLTKSIETIKKNDKINQNKTFIEALDNIEQIYNHTIQFTKKMVQVTRSDSGFSTNGYSLDKFKKDCDDIKNALGSIKIEPLAETATIHFASEEEYKEFNKEISAALGGGKVEKFNEGEKLTGSVKEILSRIVIKEPKDGNTHYTELASKVKDKPEPMNFTVDEFERLKDIINQDMNSYSEWYFGEDENQPKETKDEIKKILQIEPVAKDENAEKLKTDYEKIKNQLSELANANKLNDITSTIGKASEQIDNAYKATRKMAETNNDLATTLSHLDVKDNSDTISKLIYVKTAMSGLGLSESVYLTNFYALLNEADKENAETNNISKLMDRVKNEIIDAKISGENAGTIMSTWKKIQEDIDKEYDALKDKDQNAAKVIGDKANKLELLYAMNSYNKNGDTSKEMATDTFMSILNNAKLNDENSIHKGIIFKINDKEIKTSGEIEEDKKNETIASMIEYVKNNKNDYESWKSKNKNTKANVIKYFDLIFGLSKESENREKLKPFIDETKKIIDNITPDNIAEDKFIENLGNAFKKTEDGIEQWCGDDEEKLKLYTSRQFPDDIKNDILTKVWNAKAFLTDEYKKMESFNPFSTFDLLMLLEADEEGTDNNNEEKPEEKKKELGEKVKAAAEKIKELLGIAEDKQFITDYTKWKNAVLELAKEFGDKLKIEDKEPVKILNQMGKLLKQNNEEKPENSNEGGEGGKTGESGNNT